MFLLFIFLHYSGRIRTRDNEIISLSANLALTNDTLTDTTDKLNLTTITLQHLQADMRVANKHNDDRFQMLSEDKMLDDVVDHLRHVKKTLDFKIEGLELDQERLIRDLNSERMTTAGG